MRLFFPARFFDFLQKLGPTVTCYRHVGNHNGVDYHAPSGTPVWAVSNGTVTRAGWDEGGGNTGKYTTGPHLHFGLKRGGGWVDPLNQNFPRAEPLEKNLMADFKTQIAYAAARLAAKPVAALKE